jgi:hypothetical protein
MWGGFVTRARRRLEIGAQVENLPHDYCTLQEKFEDSSVLPEPL